MMYIFFASVALAAVPSDFNIAAGDASDRLGQWSQQTHIQILYSMDVVYGVVTHPVRGRFEPMDALRIMLQGTDLAADLTTPRSVAVFEAGNYCHPERGANAPLPPCVQKPLVIDGETQ